MKIVTNSGKTYSLSLKGFFKWLKGLFKKLLKWLKKLCSKAGDKILEETAELGKKAEKKLAERRGTEEPEV